MTDLNHAISCPFIHPQHPNSITNTKHEFNFRFIARSWHRANETDDTPYFKFTYYGVSELPNPGDTFNKLTRSDIRQSWEDLLCYARDCYPKSPDHIVPTCEFFHKQMLAENADPPRLDLRFHHHLVHLQAATPVAGQLPGALQRCDDTYAHANKWRAYLITLDDPTLQSFDVHTILLHSALSPECTFVHTSEVKQHLPQDSWYRAYRQLTDCLTGRRDDDRHMLWFPVYEDSRAGYFIGRPLGWLFCFLTRDSFDALKHRPATSMCSDPLYRLIISMMPACNTFSQRIIASDTASFLAATVIPRCPPDTSDDILQALATWEGWHVTTHDRLPPDWTGGNSWYSKRATPLQFSLGPTPLDNPRDWHPFHEPDQPRQYVSLSYPKGSAVPRHNDNLQDNDNPWALHSLSQIRRIRRLICEAAHATRTVLNAKHAEAQERAADFAHDVKNYTDPLITFVSSASARYRKSEDLYAARTGLYTLNTYSHALQDAFRGIPADKRSDYHLPPIDALLIIDAVVQLLLNYHGHAAQKMELCYHGFKAGAPTSGMALTDCVETLSLEDDNSDRSTSNVHARAVIGTIALFRESIQNIRVHKQLPSKSTTEVHLHYSIAREGDYVRTEFTQRNQDLSSAAKKLSQGIDKARRLFGPRGQLPIGDIHSESTECLDNHYVERLWTVDRYYDLRDQ